MEIQGIMYGFDAINEFSKKNKIEVNRKKFEANYGQGSISGKKVILLKPQMYMNLSGIPVKKFKDFFKIEDDKISVEELIKKGLVLLSR